MSTPESDAKRLAQAKMHMRADRYVRRPTKPPSKTQDFVDWLDAALRLIDERDAEIAFMQANIREKDVELARLHARLTPVRIERPPFIVDREDGHQHAPGEDAVQRASREWYSRISNQPTVTGTIMELAAAITAAEREATERERERCAAIVDGAAMLVLGPDIWIIRAIAAAIRALSAPDPKP